MADRIKFGIMFLVVLAVEVFIALYVRDRFIRPYVGDILVVIVIYCAVRTVMPDKLRRMPLWIFLFAALIECLQYFQLVQLLGLEEHTFWRILIGSTFDWKDIICYGIGCLILGFYEVWISRRKKLKTVDV